MSADGPIWPISCKPYPDELLSSWLLRNIRAMGESPHSFCRAQWPSQSFWTRDLDRSAGKQILEVTAYKTETSIKRALQTTLQPHIVRILGAVPKYGIASWVLPIGVFHRLRRRHGLQYCPKCLGSDQDPYFRLHWRMAYQVACSAHGCLLNHSCPECQAPVVLHRSPDLVLSRCHVCGHDLSKAPVESARNALKVQGSVESAIRDGFYDLGTESVPLVEFFAGFRVLISALGPSGLAHMQSVGNAAPGKPKDRFEFSEQKVRAFRMELALSLLRDWPRYFLNQARQAGSSYGSFHRGRNLPPAWLESVLVQLPRPIKKTIRRRRKRKIAKVSWKHGLLQMEREQTLAPFVVSRINRLLIRGVP